MRGGEKKRMKKNLKILSVIGAGLVLYALLATTNQVQYLIETLGIIALIAYSWDAIKNRTVMLWVSGGFTLWYMFGVFSIFDIIFWALAFIFLYNDKVTEKKKV